MNTSLQKQRL